MQHDCKHCDSGTRQVGMGMQARSPVVDRHDDEVCKVGQAPQPGVLAVQTPQEPTASMEVDAHWKGLTLQATADKMILRTVRCGSSTQVLATRMVNVL